MPTTAIPTFHIIYPYSLFLFLLVYYIRVFDISCVLSKFRCDVYLVLSIGLTVYVPAKVLLLSIVVGEGGFNILEHLIGRWDAIDLPYQILTIIIINNGHWIVIEHIEALFQRFNVIIGSARIATQATFDAYGLSALEEQHKFQINLFLHLFDPALEIVLIARETVDKEFTFVCVRLQNVWVIKINCCVIRNRDVLDKLAVLTVILSFMAFSSSEHVTATGTICPWRMWFSIISPNLEPARLRSARSKSPADKCT